MVRRSRAGDEHESPTMEAEIQPKRHEIWVYEFNDVTAHKFRQEVLAHSEQDTRKPITVYINSYGGAADALAAMIETMDEVPNPFVTVCMGKAMSAGAILLSHGDLRFCGRHSRIMIHEMLGGTGGNVHDMKADTAEIKRLNDYFMGLLATNCGLEGGYEGLRNVFKEHDGREIYLSPEQAKEFGIIDEIGAPAIVSLTLHQVSIVPQKEPVTGDASSANDMLKQLGLETEDAKPKKSKVKPSRKPKR